MSDTTIDELLEAVAAVQILRATIDRSETLLQTFGERLEAAERRIADLAQRMDTLTPPERGPAA